ncbi:hypothetical protein [Plantactinospora sp. KLBMP9567]|uniref:hypothetical protein n=1 Tax=Plantactinospora sp. KLBMP9567 TaxID=3085900 RepID=UPI0029811EE4|nr:hypothetical protein [Plantactinospora sp. KLBMP9567]MDW5327504.1 hypothetical protein [Plantactinospora sp. KLBMP9567]
MEVGFATSEVSEAQRPELEEVLRGIAVGPPSEDTALAGQWRGQVERVTVLRRLPGARSGAEVLDVVVERKGVARDERCVIKIDGRSAVEAEWRAVRTYLLNRPQAIFAPVDAVSRSVLDGAPHGRIDAGRAAIVYRHVADWASSPEEVPETLESIVRTALDGCTPDTAVRLVETLLPKLAVALHEPCDIVPGRRRLESLNSTLGVDLVIEVDRIHPDGFPSLGTPLTGAINKIRRHARDVLNAATRPPSHPDPNARIAVGDEIALFDLQISAGPDGQVFGHDGYTTVEVRPATTHELSGGLAGLAGSRRPVVGRVVQSRAEMQWARVNRFLPGVADDGRAAVTVHGVVLGHPFTVLRQILTTDLPGRVRATMHGDLNPRNVLVLDGQLFLIDFAAVRAERPVLGDPVWLETCLLRDVIAPRLSWPALVRLQRLLAAATRLHPLAAEAGNDVRDLLPAEDDDPALRTAFELLWAIRRMAHAGYPESARNGFCRDYLEQVTLAACRTLKWPDVDQDEDKVRAAVAAAGVAAEWLDGDGPYRHWPQAEVERLVRTAWSGLASSAGLADVVAEALRALDRYDNLTDDVRAVVDDARARVVSAAFRPVAQEITLRRQVRPPYIELEAYLDIGDSRLPLPMSDGHGDALTLIAHLPQVVVVGDAGAGKSTLMRELQSRLARVVSLLGGAEARSGEPPARFPVLIRASDIAHALAAMRGGSDPEAGSQPARVLALAAGLPVEDGHLRIGAVHVMVDSFNELTDADRQSVVGWVRLLRRAYARTPVVVGHRSLGFSSDLFGFPVAELQPVTEDKARAYITESLRPEHGSPGAGKADGLFALLHRPENRQMRELTRNPLFLWLLVQYYAWPDAGNGTLPGDVGMLFGEFARRLLKRVDAVGAEGEVLGPFTVQLQEAALETLGEALVERHNVTEVSRDEAERLLAGVNLFQPGLRGACDPTSTCGHDGPQDEVEKSPLVGPAGAPVLLQALLDSDLLRHDGGYVRFRHQLFQEYFAARVLAGGTDDIDLLRDRAMQFRWREPLRIMLGSADGQPDRARQLVELVQGVDAVFAAQLLRACGTPPRDVVDRFVAAQRTVLRSPASGTASWTAAARGLVELDSAASLTALQTVAEDQDVAAGAREIALAFLVQRVLRGDSGGERREELDRRLTDTLVGLLRPGVPDPLRRRAIEAVGEVRLTALGLATGDLIAATNPWDVVDAAYRSLRRLGMAPGETREREYQAASERRLATIDATLRATADRVRIKRLNHERLAHLERMSEAGCLEPLLSRRFSFGIAGDRFWSLWLRPRQRWIAPEEMAGACEVLQGDLDGPELVRRYAEGDDWTAVAAVHRILENHTAHCAEILERTSPRSSPRRLLAAAHAAASGRGDVERLRSLVHDVVEAIDPERVEALTALVAALPARLGVVASASVVRRLRERGQLGLLQGWPWFQLWTDLPFDEKLCRDLLLAARDDDGVRWDDESVAAVLWLNADVAGGALLDAGKVVVFPALAEAEAALLARAPAEEAYTDLPAFLGACVKADVNSPVVLESACATVARVGPDWPVQVMSSTAYGSFEQSMLADVLARIGFLARRAHDAGDRDSALDAYALLTGVRTAGLHPSVERGRLVGLAVLGDWPAVLTRLGGDDPVLHSIARNAVEIWSPGPFTPNGYREHIDIARWLAARLHRGGCEPAVRDTLLAVKGAVERQLGGYVVVGTAPEGSRTAGLAP